LGELSICDHAVQISNRGAPTTLLIAERATEVAHGDPTGVLL
jgi:hypothetical protein